MSIIHLSKLEDFKSTLSSSPKVVTDFFATWCGPCKRVAPMYEELSEKYPDVKFLKIDVDEAEEIVQECEIKCMPTFITFENGKEINRIEGGDIGSLTENLNKIATPIVVKEPENLIHLESLQEYEKITSENKIVVVDFFAIWCGPCQYITPFYKKFAKSYPDIKFLKVDVDKAKEISEKENIHCMPTFIFYYKGKKNSSFEGADPGMLEKKIKEYDENDKINEVFKSKQHEHPLKKLNKSRFTCDICDEDFVKENDDYFCIECQFNLCENCKNIEEGKPVNKEEDPDKVERIKDSKKFEEIIKSGEKVAIFSYEGMNSLGKEIKRKFKNEYPEVKFYKIQINDKTKDATKDLEDQMVYCYENGNLISKPQFFSFYTVNECLFKLCGRKPEETFKSQYHEHPLIKMKHLEFRCNICRKQDFPDFTTIFRCMDCQFDLCPDCKKREEEEEKK